MGLTINVVRGGLGRQSANTDTWGGLAVEVDAMPSGWDTNEVKKITRIEDLEQYGIVEDAVNNYYKLAYWHFSELFRLAPNATVYAQLALTANADAATILNAFNNAEDNIRIFGLVLPSLTISIAEVEAVQAALETLEGLVEPARAFVSFKKDIADAIPDFSADDKFKVVAEIANDITAGGIAKAVFDSALGMCGAAGTYLGQALRLKIHQSIAWQTYPIDGGGRWLTIGDINGASVETMSETTKENYKTQGISLIGRVKRKLDAYILNQRTAGDTSDDYATLTNGRTIDKAIGLVYDALQPEVESPVYTDPTTGQLTRETTERLRTLAWEAINTNMIIGRTGLDVELVVDPNTGSLPDASVYIDPAQNVLSTKTITVEVRLIPVGSAEEIVVNIGLTDVLN